MLKKCDNYVENYKKIMRTLLKIYLFNQKNIFKEYI